MEYFTLLPANAQSRFKYFFVKEHEGMFLNISFLFLKFFLVSFRFKTFPKRFKTDSEKNEKKSFLVLQKKKPEPHTVKARML